MRAQVLDVLEYVKLDGVVQTGDLEDGNEVVDELSGSCFSQEVVTPVLDADNDAAWLGYSTGRGNTAG